MNLAADPQFPTKWPFPPAPPARRAWGLSLPRLRRGRRNEAFPPVTAGSGLSSSAPQSLARPGAEFVAPSAAPSARSAAHAAALQPSISPAAAASASLSALPSAAPSAASPIQQLTLRQMLVDILLVAMWGALIPGLMWLGAAAGF